MWARDWCYPGILGGMRRDTAPCTTPNCTNPTPKSTSEAWVWLQRGSEWFRTGSGWCFAHPCAALDAGKLLPAFLREVGLNNLKRSSPASILPRAFRHLTNVLCKTFQIHGIVQEGRFLILFFSGIRIRIAFFQISLVCCCCWGLWAFQIPGFAPRCGNPGSAGPGHPPCCQNFHV